MEMSNTGFYIFALVAVVIAALILRHVVTCLMRTVVVVVLLAVLAFVYYFFVGQYDPEIQGAVEQALDQYKATHPEKTTP